MIRNVVDGRRAGILVVVSYRLHFAPNLDAGVATVMPRTITRSSVSAADVIRSILAAGNAIIACNVEPRDSIRHSNGRLGIAT